MTYENLLYELRGGAAWITLNRPESMNSLSPGLVADLSAATAAAGADEAVRALVITGSGRAFCAGADLKFVNSVLAQGVTPEMTEYLEQMLRAFNGLEALPKPVIAAVNGLALAGGLELVLACDLVIAVETARLGDAHANFGLIPGGGGSIRLPRRIGATQAKYLLYTGEFVEARELKHMGLVNKVVPEGKLEQAVDDLVATMAGKSPLSLSHMKKLVNEGWDKPMEAALRMELDAFAVHGRSKDLREGLAAFNEKRAPRYVGE